MAKLGNTLYSIGFVTAIIGSVLLCFCMVFFAATGVPAWFIVVYRVAAYSCFPLQAGGLILLAMGDKLRRR